MHLAKNSHSKYIQSRLEYLFLLEDRWSLFTMNLFREERHCDTCVHCEILYQHTRSFFADSLNFEKDFLIDTSSLKLSSQVPQTQSHTQKN